MVYYMLDAQDSEANLLYLCKLLKGRPEMLFIKKCMETSWRNISVVHSFTSPSIQILNRPEHYSLNQSVLLLGIVSFIHSLTHLFFHSSFIYSVIYLVQQSFHHLSTFFIPWYVIKLNIIELEENNSRR